MGNIGYQHKFDNTGILIHELKEGKEIAFDALFRTHYKGLCRFAFSFLNDFDVAEDLVQDVFSAVWQKHTQMDEKRSVDSYLYVAVRNACFTYLRDKHENVDIEALKLEVIAPENEFDSDSPELKRIWEIVENLPLQCKVIFKLVVLEEMKYKEVADALDISVNTVKTQIKIAYKTLRERLHLEQIVLVMMLGIWRKRFMEDKNGAFPNTGHSSLCR